MTGTQTNEKRVVMDDMRYDVAVVGAGQSGLAISWRTGRSGS
jgi:cation diffusion facilitator CzcD-associated flavoprotein CzcO